jgi:hypothetical protein
MWVEAKMKCDEVRDNMMKHNQFFNLLSFVLKAKQGVYFVRPISVEVDTDTVWLEATPPPFWFITVHYNATDMQTCPTTATHTCGSDMMYSNRFGKNMQLCVFWW